MLNTNLANEALAQAMNLIAADHDVCTHINDDAMFEGVECTNNSVSAVHNAIVKMSYIQLTSFVDNLKELEEG